MKKMAINYIVTVNGDKGFAKAETLDSIKKNLSAGDVITQVCYGTLTEEEALNECVQHINTSIEMPCTHIVIINDGSVLKDSVSEVFSIYATEEKTILLPIVELFNDINVDKNQVNTFKGFLNASLWKPYFAEEIGVLDSTLCTRGVDLILYGALIPISIAKEYSFKTDIKYYSFFEYLSRVIHNEIPVLGIPKVTLRCVKDYELKDVSKEEKLEWFKKAQSSFLPVTSKTV